MLHDIGIQDSGREDEWLVERAGSWPGLDDDTEKQFLGIFHDFSWSPPILRWAGTITSY